ncbi:tetratricopeptide repeat protein [Nostoc sp. UHCC 0926]|uniref:TPR end-of-group domain-containing protein n=1 Tax=unclassified Nostoc TaxID=2593658 RepID=UPI002361ECE5|nr:tetratricopeptide repeat protein [Nostoc sp. UHCC 0926]WDD33974.1 tetratricopeptide repeat protein [Nostoc sp. UHCC 0926]
MDINLDFLAGSYKSKTSFDKALELKPDYADAFYNKACCYALQGDIELAINNLQKVISLSPEQYLKMAKYDSDFDIIRENKQFQALIQTENDWEDEEEIDEQEWLKAAASNPVFDFLKDPEEDIYTLADGKPFND